MFSLVLYRQEAGKTLEVIHGEVDRFPWESSTTVILDSHWHHPQLSGVASCIGSGYHDLSDHSYPVPAGAGSSYMCGINV